MREEHGKLSSWDGKVGEKRSVYGEDLRKEHCKLMGLINVLPAMVYRCLNDSDWTMLFVNEGAFDLTGYHPEDLIGNKTISYAKLHHPADRGKVRNEILVSHCRKALLPGIPHPFRQRERKMGPGTGEMRERCVRTFYHRGIYYRYYLPEAS